MFCVFYCRGRVCAHERSRVGIIIRWQLLAVIFGYNDSDGGYCDSLIDHDLVQIMSTLVTIDPLGLSAGSLLVPIVPLRIISLVLIDPLTDIGYE
jgi:hypothetical protein